MVTKKILYVDDDESQRTSMKHYVSMLGYDIRVVGSPEEALEILKLDFYPLIITDLEMPGMDGAKLCSKIRAVNSKSVIYALSGFIAEFGPEKLEEIGFNGHLCKPINTKKLEQAIEGAFDKIKLSEKNETGGCHAGYKIMPVTF